MLFTQEYRNRITRLEVKVEEGFKAVNQRIDDINRRIEKLQTLMPWGLGVLFSGIGILIGLVIWDRRPTISPVVEKLNCYE